MKLFVAALLAGIWATIFYLLGFQVSSYDLVLTGIVFYIGVAS